MRRMTDSGEAFRVRIEYLDWKRPDGSLAVFYRGPYSTEAPAKAAATRTRREAGHAAITVERSATVWTEVSS